MKILLSAVLIASSFISSAAMAECYWPMIKDDFANRPLEPAVTKTESCPLTVNITNSPKVMYHLVKEKFESLGYEVVDDRYANTDFTYNFRRNDVSNRDICVQSMMHNNTTGKILQVGFLRSKGFDLGVARLPIVSTNRKWEKRVDRKKKKR